MVKLLFSNSFTDLVFSGTFNYRNTMKNRNKKIAFGQLSTCFLRLIQICSLMLVFITFPVLRSSAQWSYNPSTYSTYSAPTLSSDHFDDGSNGYIDASAYIDPLDEPYADTNGISLGEAFMNAGVEIGLVSYGHGFSYSSDMYAEEQAELQVTWVGAPGTSPAVDLNTTFDVEIGAVATGDAVTNDDLLSTYATIDAESWVYFDIETDPLTTTFQYDAIADGSTGGGIASIDQVDDDAVPDSVSYTEAAYTAPTDGGTYFYADFDCTFFMSEDYTAPAGTSWFDEYLQASCVAHVNHATTGSEAGAAVATSSYFDGTATVSFTPEE